MDATKEISHAAGGGWTGGSRCPSERAEGPARPPQSQGGNIYSQRGAVIVLVLVTLLLASFLLAAFIRRTGTELLADARAAERRELRAEAYSALESVLAVIAAQQKEEGALHGPDENWSRALAESGYLPAKGREVELSFEDESGRISLPQADAVTLQTALEAAGQSQADAERMANALLAWMRDGDANTARDLDAPDYESNEPAYQPAHRALRSWQELSAVEMNRRVFFDEAGRPTDVLRAFMRDFSLYSFSKTNLNGAKESVLVTLGLNPSEAGALENHRLRPRRPDEDGFFKSMTDAATVLGSAAAPDRFGTEMAALRINVTVRQGGIVFRLTTVVASPGGAGATVSARATARPAPEGATPPTERKRLDYPFTVLEIREDIEAPEPPVPST